MARFLWKTFSVLFFFSRFIVLSFLMKKSVFSTRGNGDTRCYDNFGQVVSWIFTIQYLNNF